MRQKPLMDARRRLAFFRPLRFRAAAMQHAMLEIEPPIGCRRYPLEAKDRTRARAGVNANEKKSRNVPMLFVAARGSEPRPDCIAREPIVSALRRALRQRHCRL